MFRCAISADGNCWERKCYRNKDGECDNISVKTMLMLLIRYTV